MPDRKPSNRQTPTRIANVNDDIDVQTGKNGVGNGSGYSGHEYDSNDFAIDKALQASTEGQPSVPPTKNMPSENGRRAFFEQESGAVHGSGASAGGGNPGEDFDSDPAAGDGFPITGRSPEPSDERGD